MSSNRGSAPGERRGGRKKGTPNKRTALLHAAIERAGVTPLEYLLNILRDDKGDPALRFEAAKAAAPYVHPRLAQIESKSEVEITRSTVSPEPMPADEWERTYGRSAH